MIAFFFYKYLPVNVITVNLLEDQKTTNNHTKWLTNIEKNNYLSLLGSFPFQKQPHTCTDTRHYKIIFNPTEIGHI